MPRPAQAFQCLQRSRRFGNDAGTVVQRLAKTRIGRHAHRRHEVDEHVLDDLARQITRNEDDAGAPIAGRPGRQQHRRMEYMLYAVYDGRRVVALEIQDALDTQQLLSFQTHQHGKPLFERPLVDRTVKREAEGTDPVVMAIDVVVMNGVLSGEGFGAAGYPPA